MQANVTTFLDELRATYGAVPVEPDARLTALFTEAAGPVAAVIPLEHARRRRMVPDVIRNLPGRVAAGVAGAALTWGSLASAGAVPGPVALASSDWPDVTECTTADGAVTTPADGEAWEQCLAADGSTAQAPAGDDGDDGDDGDEQAGALLTEDIGTDPAPVDDGVLPPVPTSVSEAAHIHDFDDECGNHGAYVSYFAQHGTEPECATNARNATPTDPPAGDGTLPPVPTSVSEAAHIHDFDDECGNHGAYVSYFAQHGTEPECATNARNAPPADPSASAATGDDGGPGKGKGKGKGKPAGGAKGGGRGRR